MTARIALSLEPLKFGLVDPEREARFLGQHFPVSVRSTVFARFFASSLPRSPWISASTS
jgi:hypothetical protein